MSEYQKRMSWVAKAGREQSVVQTLNEMLSLVGLSYLDLNSLKRCWALHLKAWFRPLSS